MGSSGLRIAVSCRKPNNMSGTATLRDFGKYTLRQQHRFSTGLVDTIKVQKQG